jgi:hypothetical protein
MMRLHGSLSGATAAVGSASHRPKSRLTPPDFVPYHQDMQRTLRFAAVLALWLVLRPAPSGAWVVRSHGAADYGVAVRVALAPDGNAVVAGALGEAGLLQSEAHVAKHSAADGSELWTYTSGGNGSDLANALAIDASGNVFALLSLYRDSDVYDTALVKLSGATGAQLWRRDFGGPGYQSAYSIVLASDGDPIMALSDGLAATVGSVIRFDAASGTTVWSAPFVGTEGDGSANAVALDAAGDVFVVGDASDGTHPVMLIAKLDGATGAELWRSGLAVTDGGHGFAVAVDGAGDVLAAGQNEKLRPPDLIITDMFPYVAKFAGASGTLLWAHDDLTGAPDDFGVWATSLAIDAADDVYATGFGRNSMLALKLDGATGTPAWRRDLRGTVADSHVDTGVGEVVRVHPSGAPVFGGELGNRFTATALDPATGDTLWLQDLPGDGNNSGRVYGLALDPAGWVLAAGYSTFPFIPEQGNQTNEYTVARWVDPLAPPALAGNCTPAPRNDCKAAPSRKSVVSIKDVAVGKRDTVKWKWIAADATTAADFGDPLAAGNDFSFCIYDTTSAPIFGLLVAGGDACDSGTTCWRALGTEGFRYRTKDRPADGVNDLLLRAGPAGKGRITLKRKGRPLGDLPVPSPAALTLPLTVQLQRDGGACFGATFSTPGTSDATKFTAKSD